MGVNWIRCKQAVQNGMGKRSRYLKNWLIWGSECIYHMENSIIDHVMNSATGINISEK